MPALAWLLRFSFTSLALASNSSTCRITPMMLVRSHFQYHIPSGHRMTWRWEAYVASGCWLFNVSTDVPLDFFTARGHNGFEKIHNIPASCTRCYHFSVNYTTILGGEGAMYVGALNHRSDGRTAHILFNATDYNVRDCLSSMDAHSIILSMLLSVLLCFVALFFHCAGSIFGVNGTREGAWDMLWTKQVCETRNRPQRPNERMMPWAWHAWVYTYPWNPWYNDPLNYPCRCLVLVANVLMTFLTTAVYGFIRTNAPWEGHVTVYQDSSLLEDGLADWVEDFPCRSFSNIGAVAFVER
eukprot:TRINITY_DN19021_c0_g3_i1.p1 TRINITY_DN19021_c0_g3~~TRINITY_DN19021_c0_g3_i1.p1  ORF type:complete len:309 (-),score=21.95 TRINITY_DN19021_c0_g3_i1:204-1097(-)